MMNHDMQRHENNSSERQYKPQFVLKFVEAGHSDCMSPPHYINAAAQPNKGPYHNGSTVTYTCNIKSPCRGVDTCLSASEVPGQDLVLICRNHTWYQVQPHRDAPPPRARALFKSLFCPRCQTGNGVLLSASPYSRLAGHPEIKF